MSTVNAVCATPNLRQAVEGEKNSERLQKLIRKSHPHVYNFFHQLQDLRGTAVFPRDPKKLNQFLKKYERKIRKSVKDRKQLQRLLPDNSDETDSTKFDITTFKWLIKNFGQTGKPNIFWDQKPPQNDMSDEANISRLFIGRNSIQHCPPVIEDKEFKEIATDIIDALVSLGDDKQKLQNLLPSIRYGLSKPVSNFFGRTDDLYKLHTMVQNGKNDIVRIVVHGMAGLGKSETIRKYFHQFGDHFDENILWIMASSQTALESSFTEIADMVGLSIRGEDGNLRKMTTIIDSVYNHFQSDRILYVFDDLVNIQSLTPFLPKYKPSASIITTQLKTWPLNSFQLHELQNIDESEGKSFLENNLKDKKMDETQLNRVFEQLGGHPLAMQQFIVAVTNTMLSVEKYLELLEKKTAKILEPNLVTMQGNKSALGAIRITTEKLAETDNSELALKILNTISYLYVHEISFEVLTLTFTDDVIDIDFAVQKLDSYSLIKRLDQTTICVHSLVQKSMISQHKDFDNYFQDCLKMFESQLEVDKVQLNHESFGKEWHKHLIYFISANINKTAVQNLLLKKFGRIFHTSKIKGKINELTKSCESLLKTFTEKIGPSHKKSVKMMSHLAQCYKESCQYDKAIELYQKVIDNGVKLHDNRHPSTLKTMDNLARCFRHKGRFDDAIKIYEEVRDEKIKLHGRIHESTFATMNNLALCLQDTGQLDEAIKVFEEKLDKQIETQGLSHASTLNTMNNLALCYHDKGRLDEAVKMNETVLDERTKLHGKTHPLTLSVMNNLALCLKDKGVLDEAIKMLEEALDGFIKLHGEIHPSTLGTMNSLASCFQEKGRLDDAIKVNEEALDGFVKLRGKTHKSTLETMNDLASCFQDKGRLGDAIKIFEEVRYERIKLLGKGHKSTLTTTNNLGSCLKDKGELNEAKELLQEAFTNSKSSLGENHALTNKIKENLLQLENGVANEV